MSYQEAGIEYRQYEETLIATTRLKVKGRADIPGVVERVARAVPGEAVAGPAFAFFYPITSGADGFDVEVGVPVTQACDVPPVKTRRLPALEVLALRHTGPLDTIRQSSARLYSTVYARGVISDEFYREVYLDLADPANCQIEIHFIVHNWQALLARHAERVVGATGGRVVMRCSEAIDLETPLDERFRWVKGALERLGGLVDEAQTYDVISSCAHVFPPDQVDRLRAVYQEARARTGDALSAVDAVLAFMDGDPVWQDGPRREGHTIYAAKKPVNPQAHAEAQTEAEKRRAYCYCPIVRNHMDQGMPRSFCYCGAGWYRQQWEGATGRPVTVEIVKSVLDGDDVCEFAVHLADDLA